MICSGAWMKTGKEAKDATYLGVIKHKRLVDTGVLWLHLLPVLFVTRSVLGFVRVERRVGRGREPGRVGGGGVGPDGEGLAESQRTGEGGLESRGEPGGRSNERG